jgi:hypothetical protein
MMFFFGCNKSVSTQEFARRHADVMPDIELHEMPAVSANATILVLSDAEGQRIER